MYVSQPNRIGKSQPPSCLRGYSSLEESQKHNNKKGQKKVYSSQSSQNTHTHITCRPRSPQAKEPTSHGFSHSRSHKIKKNQQQQQQQQQNHCTQRPQNMKVSPATHGDLPPRRGQRVRIPAHVHHVVELVIRSLTLAFFARERRRVDGNLRVAAGNF